MESKNHVFLITGGGRGLGRAFALGLAAQGSTIALTARTMQELEETVLLVRKAGGQAFAFPADVTDEGAAERITNDIEERLGSIELLINNAGTAIGVGPSWKMDPGIWWHTMEVNVKGPMLYARYVLPHMVKRGYGRIINVASGSALQGIPYVSPYVVSKTALIRFTETLALETKRHNISVFCITPGAVRTPMAEKGLSSSEARKWMPWWGKIFDGGLDVPAELAVNLVLKLASGCYDILSGRFVSVKDDLQMLRMRCEDSGETAIHTLRLYE